MAPSKIPFSELQAVDLLEVGPVVVHADRIEAKYRTVTGGVQRSAALTYKYDESVFQPDEPASQNLAALMAAQPALNYGLFCKEIVIHGLLDDHDRQFLEDMARHTAREIYVNRILKPNPFLDPALRESLPGHPKEFLLARVVFDSEKKVCDEGAQTPWGAAAERCAVLSSGGKDSLLTYGLLDEIGAEVHPIFVNESGRHWYTALNAFRYFEENVALTARVWTTIDRVYNEMTRALPLVRHDFARIRADIYPVRLWTVAGLIFAALPILRKRGIGRLVVGDEFDSTTRLNHEGITHYSGYYDQSRYFDNALTRFFGRKGYCVSQFSILRPLSELLIQKTLVERYPHLQREQVSCHATHIEDGRAIPCGDCEKCRRIAGMLVAIGADPRVCGYAERQIRAIVGQLTTKGVAQELPGSEHLYHLLTKLGHFAPTANLPVPARPHPEIMKLRFDPERSPPDTIPNDLRAPLYRVLLKHADGAARRSGRLWVDFDPMSSDSLDPPYRFERSKPMHGPNPRGWRRRDSR